MTNVEIYDSARKRVIELVGPRDTSDLDRAVPACPDWTVRDLVAHMAGIPAALTRGELPEGDLQGWLDGLVARARTMSVGDMLEEWPEAASLVPLLEGSGLLLIDLAVHENDANYALGLEPHVGGAGEETVLELTLASLAAAFGDAGVGAVEVRSEARTWSAGSGPAGWTFEAEPWEAIRLLESRRTADEVRALTVSGDGDAAAAVLDGHQPLPLASLGERPNHRGSEISTR